MLTDKMRPAAFISLLIAAAFIAGCAGIEPPTPADIMKQPLGKGSLRVGMTKAEVVSLWGKPDSVRTIEDKKRWKDPREVWEYNAQFSSVPVDADYFSRSKKLYFDGDNLTDIGD